MSFHVEVAFSGLGVAHLNRNADSVVQSVDLAMLNHHGHQGYLFVHHDLVRSNTVPFSKDGYQLVAAPDGRVVIKLKIEGSWFVEHDGAVGFDEQRNPTIGSKWLGLDSLIHVVDDLGINDYKKPGRMSPHGRLSILEGGELNARTPLQASARVAREFCFRNSGASPKRA